MAGYVKIQQVVDDIMEHPLLLDVSLERVIKYAADFMQIVGVPKLFENKVAEIEITKYKGQLPCDFYNIIQVRTANKDQIVFRATTDTFHMSEHKNHKGYQDLTYKIQGDYIFTSMEKGIIEISYNAIPVDDDGVPMIIDNPKYINALQLYIKKRLFTILFDLGKLQQPILQNVQQEYAWAVGQASADLIKPSIDEMESIVNSWNTLIPRTTQHRYGFKNNGSRELLKSH